MIVHFPSPHPGAAPSDLSESSDRDHDRRDHRDHRDHRDATEGAARPGDSDPFRQLFHRHANHVNSAQTRTIQARLRHRLFAEDSELG